MQNLPAECWQTRANHSPLFVKRFGEFFSFFEAHGKADAGRIRGALAFAANSIWTVGRF